MGDDLVVALLPGLGRSAKAGFNVFDVMRHGTYEKQISNVFAWLLDIEDTHCLGDLFQRVFMKAVNVDTAVGDNGEPRPWSVRQEVNTAESAHGPDIADLVLDRDGHRIVVENYYTSDGHGHRYGNYERYSTADDRLGDFRLRHQWTTVAGGGDFREGGLWSRPGCP